MLIYFSSFSVLLKWLCLSQSKCLVQYCKSSSSFLFSTSLHKQGLMCVLPASVSVLFRPGCRSDRLDWEGTMRGLMEPRNWQQPGLAFLRYTESPLSSPLEFSWVLALFLSFSADCLALFPSPYGRKMAVVGSSQVSIFYWVAKMGGHYFRSC